MAYTKRTDVHRPSAIEPLDYEFVVVRCREDEEMGGAAFNIMQFNEHRKVTGAVFSNHVHGGGCGVCGAHCLDYAIFWHRPSNRYITAGLDCTDKIEHGHGEDFRRITELRRSAAKRKARVEVAMETLTKHGMDSFAELIFDDNDIGGAVRGYREEGNVWLETIGLQDIEMTHKEFAIIEGKFFTYLDMVRNLVRYGNWSDKQVNFATNLFNFLNNAKYKLEERRSEEAKLIDAPEGKVQIKGKVLSRKLVENAYGYAFKMLVMDERQFKVWSTVPSAIDPEVGDTVQFNATLTRSDDDRSFAFAKRPSKASIVETKE